MGSYHACIECGSSLEGKRGTRGVRKFCDKSCAQSYRNRLRATRDATPPPPERGVRFVPLTRGMFARVDAADFADVSRWNWCAMKVKGGRYYAVRSTSSTVLMHRHLMGDPPEDVDHQNRDSLDNRRQNLRKATTSQNGANCLSRGGSSRFKGVSLDRRGGWRVAIRKDHKTVHIGRFAAEEAAARAHDEAARRLHGEFARVNFPRDGERSALHDE